MSERRQSLDSWLSKTLSASLDLEVLPGDASFRRYYRTQHAGQAYIIMDAPPALEDCRGFIAVAKAYLSNNIRAPKIFAENSQEGFLLLEDFGDNLLSTQLNEQTATTLYHRCFDPLLRIQAVDEITNWPLPHFDQAFMMRELDNFIEWFLVKFLNIPFEGTLRSWLSDSFIKITDYLAKQPLVGVHRDYHSRNLIVLNEPEIGVLDFQDAVLGPITYDLVSLVRDCYVDWPQQQVQSWLGDFYSELPRAHKDSAEAFEQAFDWQGLQRHLKALFIFARKWVRDGSKNYLGDIPRTLQYVINTSEKYPELSKLHEFASQALKPRTEEVLGVL